MTKTTEIRAGLSELAAARAASRRAVLAAFLFSALVNVLMLTAPLYMLQVYDRVLVSRSEETLLALSLVVSRMWWKLPSSGLRACNDGSSQAARSRDIGTRG